MEVNCAAIPEELIESELFGHTKGSFTGASESKKGKFELADGGTLFLDEIGDMTLKTQAKVLRAVEEQRFQPIGAPASVRVDVRVVAATNKNLASEIAAGRFREDLFYRLNVIPFFVPPLRERREDIPVLARYFMRMFSAEHGRAPKEFTADALDLMTDYSWPGNVRELRNEIERLVIMVQDEHDPGQGPVPAQRRRPQLPASTLHEARAQYEKEFILSKLQGKQLEHLADRAAAGPGAQLPVSENEDLRNREIVDSGTLKQSKTRRSLCLTSTGVRSRSTKRTRRLSSIPPTESPWPKFSCPLRRK